MKIYLAGPLFTTAEQEFNRQLRDALESAGHEVWLPQEHEPRQRSATAIFETDVAGLDAAEIVVANMEALIRTPAPAGNAVMRTRKSRSFFSAPTSAKPVMCSARRLT